MLDEFYPAKPKPLVAYIFNDEGVFKKPRPERIIVGLSMLLSIKRPCIYCCSLSSWYFSE